MLFYFVFNRTYVYILYNLIVYLISRYRIKFYTIIFILYYV
nr:MAG TPA: Rifin [Caudoviricetes sp.]